MGQKLWNTLKSMRFAIILLMVVLAASVFNLFAGEFIAPVTGGAGQVADVYKMAYGEPRAMILLFLQMQQPYHSWWYTGLLGLVTLSLLVCAIDRAPTVYQLAFKPHFVREPQYYRTTQPIAEVRGEAAVGKMETVLRRHGFRVWREMGTDGVVWLAAEKRAWAYWGAWLVHVGFILLIVGGAMIARGSYTDQVQGLPGSLLATDESEWGFNVRIDDFKVEYWPLDEGQWVQVDGNQIGRTVTKNADGSYDVEFFRPEHQFLKGVAAERIANRIDNWSGEGRLDQANISDYIATLTVIENGREVKTERVEVNHPLRYRGFRFYQSSFSDQITDAEGRWTTILTVRKDSGAEFVWVGIGLVTLGVIVALYFVPRRIVGMVRGTEAMLTGTSARSNILFEGEFVRVVKEISS
jgi:cytochrome c biogenesis protein